MRKALWLLLVILLPGRAAWANSSFEATYQGAGSAIENTLEYVFDKDQPNQGPKIWTYGFSLNVDESQMPASYKTIIVPILYRGKYVPIIPAFTTTIYNSSYDLNVHWTSPSDFTFGLGYAYSRQEGDSQPTVLSNTFAIEFDQKWSGKKAVGSDFRPSIKTGFRYSYDGIDAKNYNVYASYLYDINLGIPIPFASVATLGEVTIDVSDYEFLADFDALSWISGTVDYQIYNFDNDPNRLAYLRNPNQGFATSLNSYDASLSLTFHLNEDWDLYTKIDNSVAETSDQTSTNAWNTSLIYSGDDWTATLGYQHLAAGSNSPLDYVIVGAKYIY